MNMVEVDPQLFIKCRLCLKESGTYQIVPSVREQIHYCFAIYVEPFDGLPQLICKECQCITRQYSDLKKSFIQKQDELKKKIKDSNIPDELTPDNEPTVKRENSDHVAKYVNKRRKISVLSTSSDEVEGNVESNNKLDVRNLPIKKIKHKDWTKNYQKTFACRLCNSNWTWVKSAREHKKHHQNIKSKYSDIFKKCCRVVLPRIDNKPNLTGSINQVVHSKKKIVAQCDSEFDKFFYIVYDYTGANCNTVSDNESIKHSECNNSDDSDSSSKINVRVGRLRRRRLCSRSSNETVVLENDIKGKSQENDCISIVDTDSDCEAEKVNPIRMENNKSLAAKTIAVSKLIAMAQNKYLKKHEKPDRHTTESLSRKVTSIGRQIINKRGFNSTRLMKYMEHMNLDIIWLSRSPHNVTSNSNYSKIIPRCRYSSEKNINHFKGYEKKYDIPTELSGTVQTTAVQRTYAVLAPSVVESRVEAPNILESQNYSSCSDTLDASLSQVCESNGISDLNSVILYSDTKKLLNAYPVANPRQIPKKFISDPKNNKTKFANVTTLKINTDEFAEVSTSNCENSMLMPVITLTTSLAVPQTQITSKETSDINIGNPVDSNQNPNLSAPRIKVKSVAELMSRETLNRMKESTAPPSQDQCSKNDATLPKISDVRSISPAVYNSDDYVILDTVELPNTKTSSPFKYFRMLLQVHNLHMLDTDVTLSGDLNTLIKFKVLYKQETNDQPVVLCLSLFCAGNTFCLKIKDRNEENINMTKISANWQWEILKIYRGDVVSVLLRNARKISQEAYDNTYRFICLLKSINFVSK